MRLMILAVLVLFKPAPVAALELGGGFGLSRGGTVMGLDVVRTGKRHGFGAQLRRIPKNEDEGQTGMTMVGGYMRPGFDAGPLRFYALGGFGIVQIDPVSGDGESSMGPLAGFGVHAWLARKLSVGIETVEYQFWTGDDYKGGATGSTVVHLLVSL